MLNRLNLINGCQGTKETRMLTFDTRGVPSKLQRDYWQDTISQIFVPLACDISAQTSFFGTLEAKNLGNIPLVEVKGCGQHVARNSANIKYGCNDEILITFLVEGRMGIQHHGREQSLSIGQFVFYDTQSPYDLYLHEQFDQLVLMISREQFQQSFGRPERLCGYAFGGEHPLRSLLLSYAQDLFRLPNEQMSSELQSMVVNKFLDLLSYVTLDQIKGQSPKLGSSSILLQVKHLILENLDNSELNIHDIAQNLRISSRYISKLFQQEETTFGRYVLQNRLQLTKRMLIQTGEQTHKINQIAYQCGFNDMSTFSREFKKYYGISPSMMRKEN